MKTGDATLRPMSEQDLPTVLEWRNHPEIRRYMFTQHEIGAAEHRQWFERAARDPGRRLMIFELDSRPQGYVGFELVNAGRVADWGFYLRPTAPRGIGSRLGAAALAYAFEEERFHKLCGRALEYNGKSIRFHLSLGFVQEGLLTEQHFDGRDFHSVACFGLLARHWRAGGGPTYEQ